MALSSQWILGKVFNIRGYSKTTDQLVLSLKKMKETTFTNDQTTTYVTGGPSGARLSSFDTSKIATFSGASAVVSDELMAAQTGTAVETLTNSTLYRFEETLTITSNAAVTTYTATGTAGSEIDFAYIVDSNGSTTAVLTQDAAATPTKFSYTPGTKTLNFFAGQYANGTQVKVVYNPTASSMKHVQSNSDTFSMTLRIEADCLLKDACSDQYVLGQLRADKGHISGAFEWSLTDTGEAAVHNFTCELLEDFCGAAKIWDFYILEQTALS